MEKTFITSYTEEQIREMFRQELVEVLANFKSSTPSQDEDRWLSIEELIDYLPGNPSKGTIYMSVSRGDIPSHKNGKRLAFRKSSIDNWLKSKCRKTSTEIAQEARNYTSNKKAIRA